MAYHKIKMHTLKTRFGLQMTDQRGLFADAPPAQISDVLRLTIQRSSDLALEVGSEKARSEFIVAPILAEVRELLNQNVGLHSGKDFSIEADADLSGECDFLFSLSPVLSEIRAPAVAIVEAKKGDLDLGLAQCLAEMIAAQKFNAAMGETIPTIYGAITTGSNWKFLMLNGAVATLDRTEYYLIQIEQIVGVFVYMLQTAEAIRNAALSSQS